MPQSPPTRFARSRYWLIGFGLTAALVSVSGIGASVAQAQAVRMSGEYHSSNGALIDLPFNPPTVACSTAANDARCHRHQQVSSGSPQPPILNKPQTGVTGSATALTAGAGTNRPGLQVGGAVTLPTHLMSQMAGPQFRQFQDTAAVYGESNFTFQLPGGARAKNPPAQTRQLAARSFSLGNPTAHGQNNGLTTADSSYVHRAGVDTTVTRVSGLGQLTIRYSGGNGFGGTMAALLDGTGHLFVAGPSIDAIFPTSQQPVVGRVPIGSGPSMLRTENGAGWDYTVMRTQPAGLFKGFPSAPSVIATPCPATPPPTPGCNVVSGFDTNGFSVAPLPGATTTKHLFAWTTGTISIVKTDIRGIFTITATVTAMGYDTIGVSSMGGPQRNLGLVAGSYAIRNDGLTSQLNVQMIGVDLAFVPEPGATGALTSGLGLLGVLGGRRRR